MSLAPSNIARKRSSLIRKASSARFRSVISRYVPATRDGLPSLSRSTTDPRAKIHFQSPNLGLTRNSASYKRFTALHVRIEHLHGPRPIVGMSQILPPRGMWLHLIQRESEHLGQALVANGLTCLNVVVPRSKPRSAQCEVQSQFALS